MTVNAVIDYDPVHRVSTKKEYAIKRTHLVEALQLLLAALPHGAIHRKRINRLLEHYMNNPHQYLATSRDRIDETQVDKVYQLLDDQKDCNTPAAVRIRTWRKELEDKFCRTKTHPWTAIARVDREVVKPFQRELKSNGITITPSAWGPHVTWVKKERPTDDGEPLWGFHQDEQIKIKITSNLIRGGRGYWWVDIESPSLIEYREQLGLNPRPRVPFHITIGKEA